MRFHILSPDSGNRIDGALFSMLIRYFPEQYTRQTEADVVIVPLTRLDNFHFNSKLRDIFRPWILLDFTEINWDYFDNPKTKTLLFGADQLPSVIKNGWNEFNDFVRDQPPLVYFKRELLAADATNRVRPIDWPCPLEIPHVESQAQFNSRPLDVFYCWGYSHPARANLHADIFKAMGNQGIDVCSDPAAIDFFLEHGGPRKWASIYSAYYSRRPMAEILGIQAKAKVSVSMPGAGQKCFRHAEAPVGSVMVMANDRLAWAYPWEDGVNCLRIPLDYWFFQTLKDRLVKGGDDLYRIYLASQIAIQRYQPAAYIRDYVTPTIEAAL